MPDIDTVPHDHTHAVAPTGPQRVVPVKLHRLESAGPNPPIPPSDVLFDTDGLAYHRTSKGRILPHAEAHREDPHTIVALRVSKKDEVIWSFEKPFRIVSIDPRSPFEWSDASSDPTHRIRSGPAKEEGHFKVTFEIEGGPTVDPDLEIFP